MGSLHHRRSIVAIRERFDADEALAMSLGLSARGNRTRPLAVKAKYRTSSPRIACTPGNIRDGFTPCGESHALPLSYGRARAPPGGFEPPTLRLPMQPISSPPENRFGPRVARGRWKSLGNRRFRRFPDRNAEPFSRSARHPRRTGPRGADSTARSNRGGIRTRFPWYEVSEIFTTSVRSLFRRGEKPRRRGSPGGTVEFSLARGPSFGVEVTRPVTTRDRSRPGFSFRGKGRTSTAPKGLRFQTKERGSSPPGTISRACAALASGGTAEFRWPEAFDIQRSNETRHHPE